MSNETREETDMITAEPEIRLGMMSLDTPQEVVERASEVATALAQIINKRKLYTNIHGKSFVHVEGWTTLGAMLGVLPREVSVIENESGDFEAVVELIRAGDGAIIGRGSAICGSDEPTWAGRKRYARRSMAITRATGKAYRLGFSWIMALAGYDPTPAEEMTDKPNTNKKSKWEAFRKEHSVNDATIEAILGTKLVSEWMQSSGMDIDHAIDLILQALEQQDAEDDAQLADSDSERPAAMA